MLGRLGNDLDFTTNARPEAVLRLLNRWAESTWDIGIRFGTVGALKGRLSGSRSRRIALSPTTSNPETGRGFRGHIRRRPSFAVTSRSTPWRSRCRTWASLICTVGWDLGAGLLRTPGRPEDSFDDDPLRMMRAARFASQLEMTVVPEAVAAMTAMADRLAIVSAERIRDELSKLLLGEDLRRGPTLSMWIRADLFTSCRSFRH